jgi:hypothetical protein
VSGHYYPWRHHEGNFRPKLAPAEPIFDPDPLPVVDIEWVPRIGMDFNQGIGLNFPAGSSVP